MAKGAQVLDIQLYPYVCAENYVFPHWILSELDNASTLNHLSLRRCVLKPPVDFNKLARLKTLRLNTIEVVPGFLEQLFSVCVLLEGLTLINCNVRSNLIVIGPSLHLKDLKVLRCNQLAKIEVDAVNLSSFEFEGIILKISCMKTPLLVRFFFRGYNGAYAFSLLALCPGLETLHQQLFNKLENIPETDPKVFKNLKHLRLDLFMPEFDLGSVVWFLKAAPLLEELVITTQSYKYQGEVRNLSGFSHNHLIKVKMQGFQGNRLEIELAVCILKIAAKLEVMVIDPLGELFKGRERWTNSLYYQEGNEDKNENEDVDSEDENDGEDGSMDAEEGTQHENEEDEEVEEGSDQHEGVDAWELKDETDDEDKDEHGHILLDWERRGRAAVQERLKEVNTDAQVIIL